MNRLSIPARTGLLALAEIIGIIGMLLVNDSAMGDIAFFALAAAPLVLGLGYGLTSRSRPAHKLAHTLTAKVTDDRRKAKN